MCCIVVDVCFQDECTLLHLPVVAAWSELFDVSAVLIYIAWFVWQLLLAVLPTGTVASGLLLKTGNRLRYRCNGETQFDDLSLIKNCQDNDKKLIINAE